MEKVAFLVDDDPAYQEHVSGQLKHLGYKITSFFRGDDCVDALRQIDPSFILLDQELSGESGFDVLKKIKSVKPKVPVIFLSPKHETSSATEAVRSGAFDYIEKNGAAFVNLRTAIDKLNTLKTPNLLDRVASIFRQRY